jgi:hypothetical protein
MASGDRAFTDRCIGLLEHPVNASRARSRLGKLGMLELAPRLRRRASALVLRLPAQLVNALEHDATLVRTGLSAARAHGWTELGPSRVWCLDAYVPVAAVAALQQQADRLDDDTGEEHLEAILLRRHLVADRNATLGQQILNVT